MIISLLILPPSCVQFFLEICSFFVILAHFLHILLAIFAGFFWIRAFFFVQCLRGKWGSLRVCSRHRMWGNMQLLKMTSWLVITQVSNRKLWNLDVTATIDSWRASLVFWSTECFRRHCLLPPRTMDICRCF